jgi:ribosomal protein S12 methylthiotransferase accessory factor
MGERSPAVTLADVVSPYVGLVTEIDELLPSPDDALHFHVVAAAADPAPTLGRAGGTPGQPGSGYGADHDAVRAAALGEAIERYSATFVPEETLVTASAAELGSDAVAPESFALFAPEQLAQPGFPFVPFTRETRLRWVRARRLSDDREAWLPAQLVYLGFPLGEPLIGHSTSNGLAAGETWERALLPALLELVERDAFMLAWNARISYPLLAWQTSRTLREYYDRYLARSRARLTVVDLSTVHDVPVALAIVRGSPGAFAVGAGAATTIEEAWRKAVCEAYAVRRAARELVIAEPRAAFAPDFRDVTEFVDHIKVYAYAENEPRAGFLDASPDRRLPAAVCPLDGIDDLLARLARNGIEAYAVDVTSPDVREAGLVVVRAVAPRLLPLDVRHDARFLGGDRLRSVCAFADVNPDPHPFP